MARDNAHIPSSGTQRRWGPVWAVFAVTSAVYFLSSNEADNDLWVHVRIGLDILASGTVPRADTYSYTATGAAWIDHEWLTHLLFGAVYGWAGGAGLLAMKLIVAGGTAALLGAAILRRAASPHVRGAVLVLALAVLARGFAIRPQIASYLAVALLLAWLQAAPRAPWRVAAGLVVLIVVWANAHGGVLLGIGIAGLCAGWHLLETPRAGVILCAAAVAAVGLALVANPYGPGLAGYLWHELSAPHPITEWQPIGWEAAHGTFLLLAALFVAGLPFASWRRHGWEIGLGAVLLVLAVRQQRHTPLFALAAAPVVAASLERAAAVVSRPQSWRLSGTAQALVQAAILVLAGLQIAATAARLGRDRCTVVFDAREYPAGAVRFLRDAGVSGHLAVPLEWGGYALWHLAPAVRVSLDGRFATVYRPAVVRDNFAFFAGGAGWNRLIDRYPTDMVLAPATDPLRIAVLPEWRRVYSDPVAAVFVRQESDAGARLPAAGPAEAALGLQPFP